MYEFTRNENGKSAWMSWAQIKIVPRSRLTHTGDPRFKYTDSDSMYRWTGGKIFGMGEMGYMRSCCPDARCLSPSLGQLDVFQSAGSRAVIGCKKKYPRTRRPKNLTANRPCTDTGMESRSLGLANVGDGSKGCAVGAREECSGEF